MWDSPPWIDILIVLYIWLLQGSNEIMCEYLIKVGDHNQCLFQTILWVPHVLTPKSINQRVKTPRLCIDTFGGQVIMREQRLFSRFSPAIAFTNNILVSYICTALTDQILFIFYEYDCFIKKSPAIFQPYFFYICVVLSCTCVTCSFYIYEKQFS